MRLEHKSGELNVKLCIDQAQSGSLGICDTCGCYGTAFEMWP